MKDSPLENYLIEKGIKFQAERFSNSKTIKTENGIRFHIYKEQTTICFSNNCSSIPNNDETLDIIKAILEHKK